MDYLILVLATWRVSSLLTNDSEAGPFGMLDRVRRTGRKFSAIFTCLWCCSIWVGLAAVVAYWAEPGYTTWACLPFALSGGAIVIDRVVG